MKRLISLFLMIFFVVLSFAQNPVSWNYSQKKIGDKIYELHLTATIERGWHIYSQHQSQDAIALPTTIKFNNNPLILFKGIPQENGNLKKVKDEELKIEISQFEKQVDFVQIVNLKAAVKTNVSGQIQFMACTEGKCLPPKKINFSLMLD